MINFKSVIGNFWDKTALILIILVFSCNGPSKSVRNEAEHHVSVGIAKYKNGDNYLAITAWKKALALIPEDAEVHNFIGIAYEKLNSMDSAIVHFELATEFNSDYYQAYNNLGYAYFKKRNYEKAELCFKSSFTTKPDYAPAQLNLKKIRDIRSRIRVSDSIKVARSEESIKAHKINIAVLNLNPINMPKKNALAISRHLRSDISRIGYYNLLALRKMSEKLKENGFQRTVCISPECLVEAGKLLDVEQVIGGSIRTAGTDYSIKLRLMDIETGKILAEATEEIEGHARYNLTKGIAEIAQKLSNDSRLH